MPPAPQLSDYQAAAVALYAPQEASEAQDISTTLTEDINTEEAGKAQIGTNYTTAMNNLSLSVQQNTGKIDQLYTERLGGNFSGLEGNDLGTMYASADNQQATIEATRTNALNAITTAETNATLQANQQTEDLGSKYNALETTYAESNYATASKDYLTEINDIATQEYHQEDLGIQQEKVDASIENTATTQANTTASEFKAAGKETVGPNGSTDIASTSAGYNFTGPNGTPVNMNTYLNGTGAISNGQLQGNGGQLLALLSNGSAYDRAIYGQVKNDNPATLLASVAKIDAKGVTVGGKKIGGANAYGF
jgi:hypothetical protein